MIQQMLAIWSLVSLPFLKPAEHPEVHGSRTVEAWLGEFSALLCSGVKWAQLYYSMNILWHCLSLKLVKTNLFQYCDLCWVFQVCWHIECSTCTASSFKIWNSSAGIPSPPLALFIVMFPKAQLTSHSRMSGSRWVITPSWSSGSLRSLLYSSSVYSIYYIKKVLQESMLYVCKFGQGV